MLIRVLVCNRGKIQNELWWTEEGFVCSKAKQETHEKALPVSPPSLMENVRLCPGLFLMTEPNHLHAPNYGPVVG